jgi:hypothetical protein
MKNITVIGSGTMGNGIAHVFAQFGYNVTLVDISKEALDKGINTITKNLDRQVAKGSLSEADKTATLARIAPVTDLAAGVKNRKRGFEAEDLPRYRCECAGECDPGFQYLFHFHHQDRGGYKTCGQSDRDALYEPGAGDEAD